jgi:hypothetical protein
MFLKKFWHKFTDKHKYREQKILKKFKDDFEPYINSVQKKIDSKKCALKIINLGAFASVKKCV